MPEIARYQRKMLAEKDAAELADVAGRVLRALRQDQFIHLDQDGVRATALAMDLHRQLTAIADIDDIAARIAQPSGNGSLSVLPSGLWSSRSSPTRSL